MKNIIVITGGAGFVGSNLLNLLLKKTKYKIISIDNYSSGSKKNHIKSSRVKYLTAHTKNIAKLLKEPKKIHTIFQVGEFASNNDAPNALFVKLLKNTNFTPKTALWDLMMKNIYSLGSYQLSSDDFVLDIYYENTNENGALVNYIPEQSDTSVHGIPLLRLLNLDNLNVHVHLLIYLQPV